MKTVRVTFVLIIALAALVSDAQLRRRAIRREPPTAAPVETRHYRGGPARTGVYGDFGPRNLIGQEWRVQTPGASYSPPVYANGALYLTDGTGREIALDAQTGVTRWRSAFLSSIVSAPTIAGDAVYVGLDTRTVVALRTTDGSMVARFDVDSQVFASPLVDRDTLYIATESGAMYAFELSTKVQKWRFSGPGPAHGHPAAWNGNVYYASGGILIALDSNGGELWRFTGLTPFFSPSIAVSDGMVYGTSGGVAYAFDAITGSQRWSYSGASASPNAFFSAPVAWSGMVIFGTAGPLSLLALNGDIGTVVWQTPLSAFIEPVFTGGVLYGGTSDLNQSASPNAAQKVYAFDVLNGQEIWSANVTGQVATGAAVGGGRVYVHTQARNVYAFH
jgi:outer membrane protein assembly factor BamB